MRILIAPDKFKGTLSAMQAARAIRDGALAAAAETRDPAKTQPPGIECELLPLFELRPLADGGEGSHDCLRELGAGDTAGALRLREEHMQLSDPNGAPRSVPYLVATHADPETGAQHRYLETALAIGLTLPGARDASILDRTTRGVGEWLAQSVAGHARANPDAQTAPRLELHLFLGGSATSDGGFGLARALGFRFYDSHGDEVRRFRDILNARRSAAPDQQSPESTQSEASNSDATVVHVYTDVQNPLDGPEGAARLFGPQKGASASEVAELEIRLAHLGELFEMMRREQTASASDTPQETRNAPGEAKDDEALYRRPGAGAAGGLALPLLYWPGVDVRFRSGIDFFLEAAGIDRALRNNKPACVISGEGATDRGSLQGKVVAGLGRMLANQSADAPPLLIVSGHIPAEDRETLVAAGFSNLYDTNTICGRRWPLTPDEATDRLRRATEHAVRDFLNRPGG